MCKLAGRHGACWKAANALRSGGSCGLTAPLGTTATPRVVCFSDAASRRRLSGGLVGSLCVFLKADKTIGFLKDRCLLRLSPRFTAGAALRIMPHRQDELWCCAASSRREKCSYILIFVHPKLKNALLCEPIIQIKFRLHRCVSYDKIFKTRPHLIIFILYFF